MELYLQKFMREHENWEELLMADPYNIKISRDGEYLLMKYSQIASDFNLPEVREARGIIFKESTMECVCHPFDKFGNYGESYCPEIDWSTASVQEKVDGSLMKVWYDNGWHLSTNGTIDAAKAIVGGLDNKTFKDVFEDALYNVGLSFETFTDLLAPKVTYMFELVSPLTRVVIPYEETKLYFLGMREMVHGNELTIDRYNEHSLDITIDNITKYFDIPKRYRLYSLEDVQNAASILPWDEEGYVVCDGFFDRVKIKSPEYVKAHYVRNNSIITWEKLIGVVLAGETEEFCIYASDYSDKVKLVAEEIEKFKLFIRTLIKSLDPASFPTRKEFAEVVKSRPLYEQPFLFRYDRLDESFMDLTASKWEYILRERGVISG